MKYRPLGRTGETISMLSLGCMRFPDEDTAVDIVRKSVDLGINYYETSCGYVKGNSELWLGKGLGPRRKDVLVSTKSTIGKPAEGGLSSDEVRATLEESLARLGADYVDFYHAWSINTPEAYEALRRKGGWLDGVMKAKDEGLIRHVGVTSHAPPDVVRRMVDDGLFEVLTVQYSLVLQTHRAGIAAARQKGMGVVVMGPLAGGLLTTPSTLLEKAFAPDDQIAGALKYVICDPGVSSLASGMTGVEQVERNCAVFDSIEDARLDIGYQQAVADRVRGQLDASRLAEFEKLLCGDCRYCAAVCPEGLTPGRLFKSYNALMLGAEPANPEKLAEGAAKMIEKCTRCGECEDACPQRICVPDHLERVRDAFAAIARNRRGS